MNLTFRPFRISHRSIFIDLAVIRTFSLSQHVYFRTYFFDVGSCPLLHNGPRGHKGRDSDGKRPRLKQIMHAKKKMAGSPWGCIPPFRKPASTWPSADIDFRFGAHVTRVVLIAFFEFDFRVFGRRETAIDRRLWANIVRISTPFNLIFYSSPAAGLRGSCIIKLHLPLWWARFYNAPEFRIWPLIRVAPFFFLFRIRIWSIYRTKRMVTFPNMSALSVFDNFWITEWLFFRILFRPKWDGWSPCN